MKAARASGDRFQLALALDGLEQLEGTQRERRLERDTLLERLKVVRLPGFSPPHGDERSPRPPVELAV